MTKQEESPQVAALEVRAAINGEPSPFNVDRSMIEAGAMKPTNIRFQEEGENDQPEIRDMLQGIENELDGIFQSPMSGDLAPESPKFDDKPYQLLNTFARLDEKELTK